MEPTPTTTSLSSASAASEQPDILRLRQLFATLPDPRVTGRVLHPLPEVLLVAKREAGAAATDAELKAFVKDRLAPYKYPRLIEFVNDLPKTATGKIQRFKLRELEQS